MGVGQDDFGAEVHSDLFSLVAISESYPQSVVVGLILDDPGTTRETGARQGGGCGFVKQLKHPRPQYGSWV